ncbi:MAG: metallopeptidase TldD-related protein [Alphaproteobacteria bacterium]|nr:metallopeptidase TldD-related protein [Alphaproteobacteria bacterium]
MRLSSAFRAVLCYNRAMFLDETDDLLFGRGGADPAAVTRAARDILHGYDDGELFMEHLRGEALVWDDGRLRHAAFGTTRGFGLRVVSGEESGFAHGNEISEGAVRRAGGALSAVVPGRRGGEASAALRNAALYPDSDPTSEMSFREKRELVEAIDSYVRSREPLVKQVTASVSAERQAIQVVRADGERRADVRPLVRLSVSVVLERGGRRESGSYGLGGRGRIAEILSPGAWRGAADEALRQARVNLESVAGPAGPCAVVLGGGWPGILLHEAIGHGLEGDFNRKGLSAFASLTGERVASRGVTIVDDGTLEGRRGSLSIDDEGTPSERTVLVDDGVLVAYMQDRMNARLVGARSTGNGRRESYACAPMVRMTNTYMLAGDDDPAELIARVKDGVYAVSFGGGQVNITNGDFTFNCVEAYRIRDGRVEEPLKGASLTGNGPRALTKVSGVGSDFALDPGVGTCGKEGQSVPVGVGQPSLLLSEMTVGGQGAD